jgi:pimeloyl-ACP methyl ester carboxylesterase
MAENFLLIHGAYHGAWCWAAVSAPLMAMGHQVAAIDLPGHGASTFDRTKVNLDVYTQAVAQYVERNDLRDLVLVGHSMAGTVLTLVSPLIRKRLKRAVFVDAIVLHEGERLADFIARERAGMIDEALARPDRCMPLSDAFAERFRATFIQDASRDLQDFVLAALNPQPVAPYLDRIANAPFFKLDLPTGYVFLEDDLVMPPGRFHPFFSGRLDRPALRTIKCGHEAMFTRPRELAQALDELAREI